MADGGLVPIVLRALRQAGWWAERLQAGTARGGGMRLASAGAPDIIAIKPLPWDKYECGHAAYMIECKSKDGTLSKAQKKTQAWCRKHGVYYVVIRSTDDLAELLR